MSRLVYGLRYGFALCMTAVALLGVAASAHAIEPPPYELDPVLSLKGDCTTDPGLDPVPDPGCPGGEHPPSGSFGKPNAVAIDPYGNEYVSSPTESGNGRIDVFDDEGYFITEVGPISFPKNIAVDSVGTMYVFTSTGELFRYKPTPASQPELGIVQYEDPPVPMMTTGGFAGAIAIDTDTGHKDQLLLVRSGTVTRYDSAAQGNGIVATKEFGGTGSNAMAIDAQRRRLYISFCAEGVSKCGVRVVDADTLTEVHPPIDGSTTPAGEFVSFSGHLPIAVDEETGEVLIGDINQLKTVYRYSASYEYLSKFTNPNFQSNSSLQMAISNGKKTAGPACVYPDNVEPGDACNRHYLFVPVYSGRVLAFHPPNQKPPLIKGISVAGISETEAELQATIKPNGLKTTYTFEYTTEQKFQAEEFTGAIVAGEDTIPAETFEAQVGAQVSGLEPGTTYRFRVRAENELGPATGANEGSFTTYSDATIATPCSNEALRTGPAALLPDCRAFELVTPPSTNGRKPKGFAAQGDTFTTVQAAPGGEAVSFRIEGGSLPGTTGTGGFNGDPYLTTRTASGWTTALAGPTGSEATVTIPGAFSPDQEYSFWVAREEGPAVIDDGETRYVRYPDGHSELIGRGSLGTDPIAKGRRITEGGTHIIFETRNFAGVAQQLEPNAPPTGTGAVYDRTADEVTHLVSLLPGEVTPAAGEHAKYVGSSPDGVGIAFQIGNSLYLRKGNVRTFGIGTGVTFTGISAGGERIFYVEGGDLLAYDTTAEEVIDFSTSDDVTPVNVATSGDRAAFVSSSVLGGANPEGEVAQPGAQNLYVSDEGQIEFVATVTDRDVEGEAEGDLSEGGNLVDGLGLWTEVLLGGVTNTAESSAARDPSRFNPSGSVFLFQSRADLTGYDSNGFPQVYRYDSDDMRLHCLSCIPTGTPATGGGALQSYSFFGFGDVPLSPIARVPNLTPSGDRVFFESTEALVSADTDEVRDVYEWEEQGLGGCTRVGGCVYLISSGHSAHDNYLYGHSRTGDDVFFTTDDVLNGFDGGGTVSIYDARVGGGFAEPVDEECAGEGCRPSLAAPPALPAPESGVRSESDNLSPGTKPKRCPKGKRKVKRAGKTRCVPRHSKHKHHKKTGVTGRAGK